MNDKIVAKELKRIAKDINAGKKLTASAYVVSNESMNCVVYGVFDMYRTEQSPYLSQTTLSMIFRISNPNQLGQELFDMNTQAVNVRYNENDVAPPFRYRRKQYSAEQVLKSVKELLYQCSEGDVPKMPLYKALEKMKSELMEYIIEKHDVLKDAKWSLQ